MLLHYFKDESRSVRLECSYYTQPIPLKIGIHCRQCIKLCIKLNLNIYDVLSDKQQARVKLNSLSYDKVQKIEIIYTT